MAENNLPTTGEELEVKNEFPATGETESNRERLLSGDFVLFVN